MEKLPTILHSTIAVPLASIGTHHKAPKGRSETQFERDLWQYFPGKIHTGLLIKRPDLIQPYVPDFAYLDKDIAIDIEIDEPYTHDTRQPLHYLNCPKDAARNKFFLDHGWSIIRFSEAQIIRSPASCCKTIASTIATRTGDSSIMAPFRQVPTLKPDRRWTKDQAEHLAAQNYREQYLATTEKPDSNSALMTRNLTVQCPICGETVRWQGHYVSCSNCGYDRFVL